MKGCRGVTTAARPAILGGQLNSWAESPMAAACGERGTQLADRTAARSGRRRGERGGGSAAHSLAPSPSANPVGDRGSIARHRSPAVFSVRPAIFVDAPRAQHCAPPRRRGSSHRGNRAGFPPGEIATGRGFSLAPFCLLGRPGASCAPGSVFSGQFAVGARGGMLTQGLRDFDCFRCGWHPPSAYGAHRSFDTSQ